MKECIDNIIEIEEEKELKYSKVHYTLKVGSPAICLIEIDTSKVEFKRDLRRRNFLFINFEPAHSAKSIITFPIFS